jgi:hypothetical protein
MALDLNNSYDQARSRLQSSKTFLESKGSIKNALKKTENQSSPSFNSSSYKLDTAALEQQIKKKVMSQFDELLGLLMANRGSGESTNNFIIKKFVRIIKILQKEIAQILLEEFIKALGCDLEQTYDAGTYYFKLSSIDLFKLTQVDPEDSTGKILYEQREFQASSIPRSNNRMFRELSVNDSITYQSLYSTKYKGATTSELFDVSYQQDYSGPETGGILNSDGWLKVTLYNRPTGPNKVSQFLVDYMNTIAIIDYKPLISSLMDAVFGAVSIKLNVSTATLDDTTKFDLLIQRILGLCFDEAREISVAGQAKTPELDDTNESFFEMTNLDTSIIEQRTAQIKKQIITFESCGNIELPVNSDSILSTVSQTEINENGDGFEECLNRISNDVSNDPKWTFAYPNSIQLKVSTDFNFIKKIPKAVINQVISPKHLFPFLTMVRALNIEYDETNVGLSDFMKKNSILAKNLMSRIGAKFVEMLFQEIKRDIKKLIQQIVLDIVTDDKSTAFAMIERLVSLGKTLLTIVDDFRKCKGVIDAILQLFNVIPNLKSQSIPLPLLKISEFLPGYSPNRAYIESIQLMQQLGLPTGPNLDGSPNLGLQQMYAQFKGGDNENKVNGKVEATFTIDAPPMLQGFKITGKSL